MRRGGLLDRIFADLPRHTRATVALRVSAVGLEFLCLLALARVLDVEAYGTYALAMTLVAIFAVPAAFGFDRLVVREMAACQALGDWQHANGLLRIAFRAVASTGFAAAIGTLIAGHFFVHPESVDAKQAILFAAILVPVLALARLRQSTLQGLGHVAVGQAPEFLVQPMIVIALTVIMAMTPQIPRSAGVAMGFQIAAAGLALLLGNVILRHRIPADLARAVPRQRTWAWLRGAATFMALIFMTTLLTSVDTLLVGRLSGNADAGVYKVATQLAMLVGLPLTAISVAMAPAISALHAAVRTEELRMRSRAAARLIFAAAVAVAALVTIGGPLILKIFGTEFAVGYVPALILSAAYLVHSAMATSGYLLIMSAHQGMVMVAFAVGVILNVIGGTVLIPRFGTVGAAASTAASLSIVSVTCAILAKRKLGINGTVFAREHSGVASA